jgi:hypothetical protein
VVLRLNADGSADASFGDEGLAFASPRTTTFGHAVIPGPGGSITVVGQGSDERADRRPPADLFVARLTATGAPDRGFAPGGVRTHDLPGSPAVEDAAPAEDGGITVAGGFEQGSSAALRSSYFVAKTLDNGLLDRNFTRRAVTFGAPVEAVARAVVPTGGERMLLAGPAATPFTSVQLLGPRDRGLRCRGVLSGSSGDDSLRGSASADAVYGRSGDDRLAGLAGADCMSGGSGDDVLSGGAGDDSLEGDKGADVIRTGAGSNVVRGGSGRDAISARNGRSDAVDCGSGRDRATVDRTDRVLGCEVVRRP